MGQHTVKPFEGSIEVNLDPTGSAGDRLTSILGSPAFDEAHPDGAHSGELVDSFEATVNRLSEELGKFLVVEDIEMTTYGRGMLEEGLRWTNYAGTKWKEMGSHSIRQVMFGIAYNSTCERCIPQLQ